MKKEEESAKKKKPKTSPAQLRVQKGGSHAHDHHTNKVDVILTEVYGCTRLRARMSDLTELELPKTMKTDFPDPADVLNFTLTIEPDEGK